MNIKTIILSLIGLLSASFANANVGGADVLKAKMEVKETTFSAAKQGTQDWTAK